MAFFNQSCTFLSMTCLYLTAFIYTQTLLFVFSLRLSHFSTYVNMASSSPSFIPRPSNWIHPLLYSTLILSWLHWFHTSYSLFFYCYKMISFSFRVSSIIIFWFCFFYFMFVFCYLLSLCPSRFLYFHIVFFIHSHLLYFVFILHSSFSCRLFLFVLYGTFTSTQCFLSFLPSSVIIFFLFISFIIYSVFSELSFSILICPSWSYCFPVML